MISTAIRTKRALRNDNTIDLTQLKYSPEHTQSWQHLVSIVDWLTGLVTTADAVVVSSV